MARARMAAPGRCRTVAASLGRARSCPTEQHWCESEGANGAFLCAWHGDTSPRATVGAGDATEPKRSPASARNAISLCAIRLVGF